LDLDIIIGSRLQGFIVRIKGFWIRLD